MGLDRCYNKIIVSTKRPSLVRPLPQQVTTKDLLVQLSIFGLAGGRKKRGNDALHMAVGRGFTGVTSTVRLTVWLCALSLPNFGFSLIIVAAVAC